MKQLYQFRGKINKTGIYDTIFTIAESQERAFQMTETFASELVLEKVSEVNKDCR